MLKVNMSSGKIQLSSLHIAGDLFLTHAQVLSALVVEPVAEGVSVDFDLDLSKSLVRQIKVLVCVSGVDDDDDRSAVWPQKRSEFQISLFLNSRRSDSLGARREELAEMGHGVVLRVLIILTCLRVDNNRGRMEISSPVWTTYQSILLLFK